MDSVPPDPNTSPPPSIPSPVSTPLQTPRPFWRPLRKVAIIIGVLLLLGVVIGGGAKNSQSPKAQPEVAQISSQPQSSTDPQKKKNDPTACQVTKVEKDPETDPKAWSPNGQKFLTDKRDAQGVYQVYVGNKSSDQQTCLTCTDHPNAPKTNLNKLMARWHPSGNWIIFGGEREDYTKGIADALGAVGRGAREALLQSGLWLDIYTTNPDGSKFFQLQNFDPAHSSGYQTGGFVGVVFTPDGKTGV
jgi:hypothetical protein